MNRWLLGGVLGLSLVGVADVRAGQPPRPPHKEAVWLNDYEAAKKAARASGKPIFVVFR